MKAPVELQQELKKYGVHPDDIKAIQGPITPDSLAYADLQSSQDILKRVLAVVEDEGRPLLYVVQKSSLALHPGRRSEELQQLSALLACRGGVSYLCMLDFGQITIFPCGLNKQPLTEDDAFLLVKDQSIEAPNTLQTLLQGQVPHIHGQDPQQRFTPIQITDHLKNLLLDVCDNLRTTKAFGGQEQEADQILALLGRAVFVRFLADRKIINPNTFPVLYERHQGPEHAFSSGEAAALTCQWLDDTFNGDLLPLPLHGKNYMAYFRQLEDVHSGALKPLEQILHKEVVRGMKSLWSLIDFAHVPAGLFSEVYEHFIGNFDKERKERQSVYYTPKHIAEALTSQAFQGIPIQIRSQARVVDPAAGAGVFLVLTLRRLVEERWRATQERPSAQVIREILYQQVRGMDINRHALLLAALSLYLTVIELDPDPATTPLPFERNLMGSVLWDVGTGPQGALGTLRPDLPNEFMGAFDLVIGNPPWTGINANDPEVQRFLAESDRVAQQVIHERLGATKQKATLRYAIPKACPDVAFLWRSMQLAKPGGAIALLMHARLLYGPRTVETRVWLARTLRIHGILNATAFFNETVLWKVKQPFIMLFARNSRPKPSDQFRMVSPYLDTALAHHGKIRIDPNQAHAFRQVDLEQHPELLRILFKGTTLDLNIVNSIKARIEGVAEGEEVPVPFVVLKDLYSKHPEPGKLYSSTGYAIAKKSSSARKLLDLKGKDFTVALADATPDAFLITPDRLPDFAHEHLDRTRSTSSYLPPLVVVFLRQPDDFERPKALLSLSATPVIYNDSFAGFSTKHMKDPLGWAYYLTILFNSKLLAYYFLMTSNKYAVIRQVINITDLHEMPIPDFQALSDETKQKVRALGEQMCSQGNTKHIRRSLDDLVYGLYGLSAQDGQVIEDTLNTQKPNLEAQKDSQSPPSKKQQQAFIEQLKKSLLPVFALREQTLQVSDVQDRGQAWKRFTVSTHDEEHATIKSHLTALDAEVTRLANETSASYVHYVLQPGKFIAVDVLAQKRYWTVTRARLLAGELLHWMG